MLSHVITFTWIPSSGVSGSKYFSVMISKISSPTPSALDLGGILISAPSRVSQQTLKDKLLPSWLTSVEAVAALGWRQVPCLCHPGLRAHRSPGLFCANSTSLTADRLGALPESEGHPLGLCPPSLSQEGWLLSDQVEQATVSEPPSTTLQVCWTNTGSHVTETLRSKQDGAEKPSLWVSKVRTPLPSLDHPHG